MAEKRSDVICFLFFFFFLSTGLVPELFEFVDICCGKPEERELQKSNRQMIEEVTSLAEASAVKYFRGEEIRRSWG